MPERAITKGQPREKGRNKGYKCGKKGHFKRECPNRKKEEQVIALMLLKEV
jgi:ribosome modulation factor